MNDRVSPPVTIYVCSTCRAPDEEPAGARARRRDSPLELQRRARRRDADRQAAGVELVPVECLSVCKRPVTVGFAAPGKWTYVYADVPPETRRRDHPRSAQRLYGETPTGLIPWRERPDALKKGVVSRVPPLASPFPHCRGRRMSTAPSDASLPRSPSPSSPASSARARRR